MRPVNPSRSTPASPWRMPRRSTRGSSSGSLSDGWRLVTASLPAPHLGSAGAYDLPPALRIASSGWGGAPLDLRSTAEIVAGRTTLFTGRAPAGRRHRVRHQAGKKRSHLAGRSEADEAAMAPSGVLDG